MAKNEDIGHSVLIVSASEQFDALVKNALQGFCVSDIGKNAAMGRRLLMERYYDLVVINAPLPDETGERFAIDVTQECSASVLLVAPADLYENAMEELTGCGIFMIAKPMPRGRLRQAIRYLFAVQNTIHRLEKQVAAAHEKMEELRTVSKAKLILVEKFHMSEDQAHRFIGKQAMDRGVSRKRIAGKIIEDYE